LPFCPRCGNEALDTDKFCLNCGQGLEPSTRALASSPPDAFQAAHDQQPVPAGGPKNPWLAALLNLFFPGLGYVYIGIGRSGAQVVFGVIITISLALTFYAGVVVAITSASSSSSTSSLPAADYIGFLSILAPFAFAYDGYHRASSPGT
jgi:zinc-ribbon domain